MKYLPYIIIAGLIVFLVFQRQCSPKPKPEPGKTEIRIVKEYDSVEIKVEVPVPVPGEIVYRQLPADIDTVYVLKEHFGQFTYKQVVRDSNLEATIFDTVSQNKIVGRGFSYKILRPAEIQYITNIPKPKMKLFAGVVIGANIPPDKLVAAPSLMLLTKREHLYGYSYDVAGKTHQAGIYWKVGLKK